MSSDAEKRAEALKKEYEDFHEENQKRTIDSREEEKGETREEYLDRLSKVPGVFGDSNTNVFPEGVSRADNFPVAGEGLRTQVGAPNVPAEGGTGTDAGDEAEVVESNGDAQVPTVGEAQETREARAGAAVDPSGQVGQNEDQEDLSREELIARIGNAESEEEVNSLVGDDSRKTVTDAAEKRKAELTS